jgi:hypothetical protein
MPELTPEPDTTGGENQKKKKLIFLLILIQAPTLHKYIYTIQLSKFGYKIFKEQFPKMQVGQQFKILCNTYVYLV